MKTRTILPFLYCVLAITPSVSRQSEMMVSQRADSLLDEAYSKGIFSGLLVISHNGKAFYQKQLGFADWSSKKPIEKNTLFNIGSLNKQFTEELIHQLVKENKVSYDSSLSRYLDLYPAEIGDRVTIQQLLDMKAGLGDYLQDPKFNQIRFTDFSLSDLVNIIKREPLLFEPGTRSQYSNSGDVILGAVIEKVTGTSFEENLRRRIADPLGLKNIFYTKAEKEKREERALGTKIDVVGNKKGIDDISNSTPAGGIYSDCADLLAFAEAKMRNALPSARRYGTGMFAGGTPFWNSVIYYNEKNGYSFVVMANTGNIADEIAQRLSSIIKNEPYPPIEFPFGMKLNAIINDKGIDYVKGNVERLAAEAKLPYDDRFLNFFGYQFLEAGKSDIAVGLFKINIGLFPKVANTWDSAAEACMKAGDTKSALKYYRMALNLDPDNPRAQKAVSELENGK